MEMMQFPLTGKNQDNSIFHDSNIDECKGAYTK